MRWVQLGCAVLGLVGVAVVVWLLSTGPQLVLLDTQGRPGPEPPVISCYSSFQVPDGLPRGNLGVSTDGLLNGVDYIDQYGSSIRIDNYCERLRSSRMATALMVGLPTVVLLSAAVSLSRRSELGDG